MSRDPAAEAYFDEVASWERDKAREAARAMRLLAWGGGLGWLTAMVTGAALVALMPLKTVEPFVIRVDQSTGLVDVVPTADASAAAPEAVTRYFLAHYVQTCERFNFPTAESDYEECAALHAPPRNQAWAAKWTRSNPDSPLNRYVDGTTLRAQVKSVSFFERASGVQDLAQVRYVLGKRAADGAGETLTHWIATIHYAYADVPKDPRARRWNPLGFKVLDFRPEPETPPESAPPALATAQVSGGATP